MAPLFVPSWRVQTRSKSLSASPESALNAGESMTPCSSATNREIYFFRRLPIRTANLRIRFGNERAPARDVSPCRQLRQRALDRAEVAVAHGGESPVVQPLPAPAWGI